MFKAVEVGLIPPVEGNDFRERVLDFLTKVEQSQHARMQNSVNQYVIGSSGRAKMHQASARAHQGACCFVRDLRERISELPAEPSAD